MSTKDSSEAKTAVSNLVNRNIDALLEMRRQHEKHLSLEEKIASWITHFTGTMGFIYLHVGMVVMWILVNMGKIPGVAPFDPFPFSMLAIFASIEAIFLTSLVLISTNRASALSERRSDLNLQINLLAEHEITRLIQMVDALCLKNGIEIRESEAFKEDVPPQFVLKKIEEAEQSHEDKD